MSSAVHSSYVLPEDIVRHKGDFPHAYVSAACGACWMPIACIVHNSKQKDFTSWKEFRNVFQDAMSKDQAIDASGLQTAVVLTPDRSTDLPDHLPASVSKAYRSAERNRTLKDCEDAAATMYRRAIDVAIREKYPDIKGLLAQRIKQLADEHKIPPALRDWADHIRWIGNEGAHEPEGVTSGEVEVLRGFTEAFLRYLITLPFEVDLRRGLIDEKGNPIKDTPIEDL